MCKCLLKAAKCIAVAFNVIFFILGLGMFGGGIYLTTHDMEDYIGKYRDKVPPISEFVPADQQNKGPIDVASLQKKADDFIDEGMDNVKAVVNKVITIVIATGVVMASVALLGIIALTCCNKKNICVLIYLIALIIIIIPFIVLMVFTADETKLRRIMFKKLESLAFTKEFVNRYFMAAIQEEFNCCGVRGSVDYFCHDIYDYVCNAGCMTLDMIWREMKEKMKIPMCKRETELVKTCKVITDKNSADCDTKLNVPKPIAASKAPICKDYKKTWQSEKPRTLEYMKEKFGEYDPANIDTEGQFKVKGSPLKDDKGQLSGCGFVMWKKVNAKTFLNYGLIFAIIIFLLLLFQIVIAVVSFFCNKKNNKQKSTSTSSGSSKSKSAAAATTSNNKQSSSGSSSY